jgi:isocitrate lyase
VVGDQPPNLEDARSFAEAVHANIPGKLLAYNCSPSFNWAAKLDRTRSPKFQRELGAMGYKFQFVTLAGFHSLNHAMFELASGYRDRGMAAIPSCSRPSSPARRRLHRHPPPARGRHRLFRRHRQRSVGGQASTVALSESTEARSSSRPNKRSKHGTALLGRRRRICRLPLQPISSRAPKSQRARSRMS